MKAISITVVWTLVFNSGYAVGTGDTVMRTPAPNLSELRRSQRTDQQVVVDGNTAFAVDLYGKLRQRPGNIVISPSSISLALGMTYAGARGETERQMANVLHFELSQERLHPAMAALTRAVMPPEECQPEIAIANRLWAMKGLSLREDFMAVTGKHYGAGVVRTVFPEPGRTEINTWVADQTSGKIKELLKQGVVDPETVLALVSAIYFKGRWTFQFSEWNTKPAAFYVTPQSSVEVPMMHTMDAFMSYAETEEVQILELPYRSGPTENQGAGGTALSKEDPIPGFQERGKTRPGDLQRHDDEGPSQFSMVVLLPRKMDGLAAFETSLTPEKLGRLLGLPKGHGNFPVYLPKFSSSSEFSLLNTLAEMGLTNVGDFRGISEDGGLFLSAVEHAGFISVEERGTEAAAATVAVIAVSGPAFSPVFRADHPFLFVIRHNSTGSLLFMGRLVKP